MIRVSRKNLLEGMKKVNIAVPSNATLDIIKGLLVQCNNNTMTLTATDLQLTISTEVECQTEMFEETFVVDAKVFYGIISKLPEDNIEIKLLEEGKYIEIKSGKSKFKILVHGQPYEFPDCNIKLDNPINISLDTETFKDLVTKTTPFTSEDQTRPILSGVLFEIDKEKIVCVALDGYRLGYYITEVETNISNNVQVIIPANVLTNFAKIITGGDKVNISLVSDDDNIKSVNFSFGNTIASTRLISGNFLNYKDVLNVDNDITLVVDKNILKNAIDRVRTLAKADNTAMPVILTIEPESNKLFIRATTDIANIKEEIEIEEVDGKEKLKIAFNPDFLYQGLNAIESEKIKILLKDNLRPVLFINDNFIYLVLPIRLGNIDNE